MKLLGLLLALSFVANIGLYLTQPVAPAPTPAITKSAAPAPVALIPPAVAAQLQANDPAATASLRALGLPESMVKALLLAQIESHFRPRARALAVRPWMLAIAPLQTSIAASAFFNSG